MYLWNWLLPMLFGWRLITFWQAVALLALCRILFGGVSGRGWRRSYSGRRIAENAGPLRHDARGARKVPPGHALRLRLWPARGGEHQSLINTPLTHEVLERGIQPPFETGCSGRAPLVCWLYAHSSERNLRPWNLISRLP